jgi:hypothetical protein
VAIDETRHDRQSRKFDRVGLLRRADLLARAHLDNALTDDQQRCVWYRCRPRSIDEQACFYAYGATRSHEIAFMIEAARGPDTRILIYHLAQE